MLTHLLHRSSLKTNFNDCTWWLESAYEKADLEAGAGGALQLKDFFQLLRRS
jgi:hypothetical protein